MTRELALSQLYQQSMHGHDFEVYTSEMVPAYTEAANLFHPLFSHVLPSPPETTVYMVGSSTEKDLHGDSMELSALQDMCNVEAGLSLFMNHDYTLPDSLYGSLLCKPIMQRQSDVVDLYLAGDTEISNEAAMKTYGYIRKGRRIGVSGGFRVLDYVVDGDEDDWFAPLKITHVQAVEFSTVGIPANQRSWVENAAYGIFVRGILEDRGDDVLRLASIVKGLDPRGYRDVVRALESPGLKKELERKPARPQHPSKLLWDGNKRTFLMSYRGQEQVIERAQIGPFLQAGINAMRQLSPYQHLNPTTKEDEDDESLQEGVCGTTSGALADKGTSWSGSTARKQIFAYADGSVSKAKTCFMYYGGSGGELTQGDFKLPFKYVAGGTPKIVFNGAKAIANVLMGGRGGVKGLSESERNSVKRKVTTIYHRFNETPPWAKADGDGKDFDPETDLDWEGIEDVDIEDIAGLEIKADGSHAPTSGNHKHDHPAYNKADHISHDHPHDNDANHDHHGSDGDGDGDDGTQDTKALPIDDDGNHDPYDGSHSHHHKSFGAKADGSQHTHKHAHSSDSNHKHSHADQKASPPTHVCSSTTCCPDGEDQQSLSLSLSLFHL